jgi:ABC-type sugar transport system ATPase subunit
VKENTIAATIDNVSGKFFVNTAKMKEHVSRMIESLHTKVNSIEDKIYSLSGGNQQKVLLARWLLVRPKILIVDEPTRGIDVGAKQEVYQILRELAKEGIAVVMISSELPEILGMSDRAAAMYQGKLVAILEGAEQAEAPLASAIVGMTANQVPEREMVA